MKDRIFVLGIDGATWKIIDEGIEYGILPNFAEIKKFGKTLELKSTIPPFTLPSWTSMITGVNPGKHGIFDFTDTNGNILDSRRRAAPTIFQILSNAGITSISINIPGTYPPDKIRGCMIADTLTTPSYESDFVFPSILREYAIRHFKDSFDFEFTLAKFFVYKNKKKLIKIANDIVKKELKINDKLEKMYPDTRLIWQVIRTTDILQHYLYDDSEENLELILRNYKIIDKEIGRLIERFDTLILVSDHGFTPLKGYIYINRLLEKYGYFDFSITEKLSYYVLGPLVNMLFQILPEKDAFKIYSKIRKMLRRNRKIKTNIKAYLYSYTSQGVVVKDKTILSEILERLKRDLLNLDVIRNIYLKENLFNGEMLDQIPDIIFEPKDGFILSGLYSKRVVDRPYAFLGLKKADHDTRGIFGVYSGKYHFEIIKDNPNVLDVTPTILNMLRITKLENFDGQNILRRKPE